MSYREAMQDGITYEGRRYKIPCSECEQGFCYSASYSRGKKYRCQDCKKTETAVANLTQVATKESRFERAVERIKKQVKNFEAYSDAVETVHRTLHRQGWYNSTEEIMVAIELLQKRVKTIHQQKVNKYLA